LRMEVGKGVDEIVLVDGGGRDLALHDLAENAAHVVVSVHGRFAAIEMKIVQMEWAPDRFWLGLPRSKSH
jgi:hypothetical protein